MKIVNPNDTTHIIDLIPRYYPSGSIAFTLTNEATQTSETITNTYIINDGVLTLTFDYTFLENTKYKIKLEGVEIVFRGKLFATSQDTQDYKLTNNVYYY